MVDNVGRTWYVKIVNGRLGAQVFLGTAQLVSGDQCWDRYDFGGLPEHYTQADVLSWFHDAVLELLERSTGEG